MTGRARGRSRGRGQQQQGQPPGQQQQQRQQSAPQGGQQQAAPASAGRGRSRGAAPAVQQQQPPREHHHPDQVAACPPPQQNVAELAQNVGQMNLGADGAPRDGAAAAAAAGAPAAGEEAPRRRGLITVGETPRFQVDMKEGKTTVTGALGVKCQIVSNFFKIKKLPHFKGLFQYNVQFDPETNSGSFKSALLHKIDDQIGTVRCFDGMTMFMPKKLAEKETKFDIVTEPRGDRAAEAFTIKITYTNDVPDNSPSTVQLMNIMFRRQLRIIDMQLVGRNYYNPKRKIDIHAHKMQIWPGFSTSILQYESDVMLCTDVSFKVLRQQTVLDAMYDIYKTAGAVNNFHTMAAKKFVGEIVLTRYNNKTYRVDDIDWEKRPSDKFKKEDGTEISYKEYLEGRYELKITDVNQPMLVSRPKAKDIKRGMSGPLHLLPEFCAVTGLSDEMRQNFTIMKDLAVHTRVNPTGRVKQLEDFMKELNDNPKSQKELTDWNMEFDKTLLKMWGRTLPAENMFQQGVKFSYKQADADWSKETRGAKLLEPVSLKKWALYFTQRDNTVATNFLQTLERVCGPMGMQVVKPKMVALQNDSARTYSQAIKEDLQTHPDIQMICTIVPNNRKDRYDAIKKICCVDHPCPSQVIVSRTLSKQQMLMSVCTKIGIQLNCKLGGQVWAVEVPLKNIMVIGIDVYHDSLVKGQSIGGFVASLNQHLTSYFSTITKHKARDEMCSQLETRMAASLRKYNEVNGCLPAKIIIYRDGVGDGQLNEVKNFELPQIKQAIKSVAEGYDPKLAMIVVKKRISTRLFAHNSGQYSNPMPGTVVDTVVTRPEWYDFFLVSQSVRQGTVSPTHYNIIHDNTGLKPDHFQKLTYKLCHLYYNWPGTVRVPAPCQYAHKLAFLVGQSIHQDPDPCLSDRLYYL